MDGMSRSKTPVVIRLELSNLTEHHKKQRNTGSDLIGLKDSYKNRQYGPVSIPTSQQQMEDGFRGMASISSAAGPQALGRELNFSL